MSYTIEYNRIFLSCNHGVVPCWLSGDNNVTTTSAAGRERRVRSWTVFGGMKLLGASQEDMMEYIKPVLGLGYNDHWKRGGTWVDDKALVTWVRMGCNRARSIESVLRKNGYTRVKAFATVWKSETPLDEKVEIAQWLATTQDLDAWIDAVKDFAKEHPEYVVEPVIAWATENILCPAQKDL